jgi:hypothetical protein
MINIFKKQYFVHNVFAVIFISIFAIGGCNDNNSSNGDGGLGETESSTCTVGTPACTSIKVENDGTLGCIVNTTPCALDLQTVISEVSTNSTVTTDTIMWIEVWGAKGADVDKAGNGGAGGYAQTTTTVGELISKNNNTSIIYYFLGFSYPQAPDHCGGAGGASTMVTFENLLLNPTSDPTESLVQLIAGGGGGASAGNGEFGCFSGGGFNGANGAVAIAGTNGNATSAGDGCNNDGGPGCSSACGQCSGSNPPSFLPEGGGVGGTAAGGTATACVCGDTDPTKGRDGYGGRGGKGGVGQSCTSELGASFVNAGQLFFSAGRGGGGGGGTSQCDAGGGGGGGGFGGGGAGGHGNSNFSASSGAGGGSFAIQSTKSSNLAPTSKPNNPCGALGCMKITFAP